MNIATKIFNKLRCFNFWKKQKEYTRQVAKFKPFNYHLSGGVNFLLYPEGQIAELLFTTDYERNELEQVKTFLKPGMVVLDLGANIGIYSLLADKMIAPTGKVIAFEPSSDNYARLHANIQLNNSNSITACKIALADIDDSTTKLLRDPGLGDGERYLGFQKGEKFKRGKGGNDLGDSEMVNVTTLDKYLLENVGDSCRVDFMKIDVEGSELSVFKGAVKTFANNQNLVIFFECAPLTCKRAGVSTEETFNFLRGFGFEIYCWDKNSSAWVTNPDLINTIGNVWACRDKKMLPNLSR